MSFTSGRIHRLLRAEGLDPGQPTWAAFGRMLSGCDTPAQVRSTVLRQLRSMDRPSVCVARVEAWLRGTPPVDVPVAELLGDHELVTGLLARTVAWCARQDRGVSLPRPEALRWANALAAAAPIEDLHAAQRAFVRHRDPDAIVHLRRVWPEGRDLTPLRRAYLRCLSEADPGFDPARSVVGHIELTLHGTPEDKRRLVDWSASTSRHLALACGVVLDVARGAGTEAACFSVSDLADGARSLLADGMGPMVDVGVEGPDPLQLWEPDPGEARDLTFPPVDRLLRILARAALGRHAASYAVPALPASADPDVPMPTAEACARIGREVWPIVATWDDDPRRLERGLAVVLAVDSPLLRPAQAALRAHPSEAAWCRALHALALHRWVAGFTALAAEVERQGDASFHRLAERWLADSVPWGFRPAGRVRKPKLEPGDEGHRYNAFALDLEGSPQDAALARVAWPYRRAVWTGTWLAGQWAPAADLVGELVRRSGLAQGRRDGLPWAHCLALSDDPTAAYDAFKVRISEVGRAPWSLDELAEWTTSSRPARTDLRTWRLRNAARARRLPSAPWSANASWTALGRDLGWIGALLWPTPARSEPR